MGEGGEVNVSLPNTQVLLVYKLSFHNFLLEVLTMALFMYSKRPKKLLKTGCNNVVCATLFLIVDQQHCSAFLYLTES